MSATNHQPQPEPTDSTENPTTMSETLVYTVEEAADILRVSRSSVFELIHSRRLTSLKIGSRRLVARADLIHFIEQCRETA